MRKPILAIALGVAIAAGALAAQAQQQQQQATKEAQDFIKTAIQINLAEIDTGKLAREKGKSESIKQYGSMMVKEHTEANAKATTIAKQIGVEKPPESTDMMNQASYLKLKVLQGETFDRSYINDMVEGHETAIKEFEKASAFPDPTGAFAKEMLPHLQKHLEEAKRIDGQLNQATVGGASQSK